MCADYDIPQNCIITFIIDGAILIKNASPICAPLNFFFLNTSKIILKSNDAVSKKSLICTQFYKIPQLIAFVFTVFGYG